MSREWVEAFHIISLVCWFAALFYLPRLFVYHAMADDEISDERFKIMERKLYRGIATPAMIATLVFGIWLASFATEHYLAQGWFKTKLRCPESPPARPERHRAHRPRIAMFQHYPRPPQRGSEDLTGCRAE